MQPMNDVHVVDTLIGDLASRQVAGGEGSETVSTALLTPPPAICLKVRSRGYGDQADQCQLVGDSNHR